MKHTRFWFFDFQKTTRHCFTLITFQGLSFFFRFFLTWKWPWRLKSRNLVNGFAFGFPNKRFTRSTWTYNYNKIYTELYTVLVYVLSSFDVSALGGLRPAVRWNRTYRGRSTNVKRNENNNDRMKRSRMYLIKIITKIYPLDDAFCTRRYMRMVHINAYNTGTFRDNFSIISRVLYTYYE